MSKLDRITAVIKETEKTLRQKHKKIREQAEEMKKGGSGKMAIDSHYGWANIDSKNDKAEAYDKILSILKED